MSKRQQSSPPPVAFKLPDWLPLMRDAFFQVRECVGSSDVAAHDLYEDLVAGRLPSAIREFDSSDVEVGARILDPDYWQQFVLRPMSSDSEKAHGGLRLLLRDADQFPFFSAMFYARRLELDQFYPASTTKSSERVAQRSPGFPRRDTRGAKSDIDWEKVAVEAAVLMIQHRYRKLVDLKNAVYVHFQEEWPPDGVEDSTLTRHLSELFTKLKTVLGR